MRAIDFRNNGKNNAAIEVAVTLMVVWKWEGGHSD